ncbi:MAG: hypothetical protein IT375_04660 [Polyangiaceae bacterium]|nr:hypothetical protein [Polyangiaceae bacterium]
MTPGVGAVVAEIARGVAQELGGNSPSPTNVCAALRLLLALLLGLVEAAAAPGRTP